MYGVEKYIYFIPMGFLAGSTITFCIIGHFSNDVIGVMWLITFVYFIYYAVK